MWTNEGSSELARRDRVVPCWMNFVAPEPDLVELLIGHFDPGLILVRVRHGLDFEPGAGSGAADQIDDRLVIDQRLSSPVQTDKRE